jgi:RecJ-like exonuclease
MRIENGELVLEKRNCRSCVGGEVATRIDCPKCDGTGNGPRGGKRSCKECFGNGRKFTWDKVDTCPKCNGNYVDADMETPYDSLKDYSDIPKVVIRSPKRVMSWMEEHIGAGLYSVVDYGRHESMTDDELIEREFADKRSTIQGIKIIRSKDDLRVCDQIAILTADNGYSVVPVFEEKEDQNVS